MGEIYYIPTPINGYCTRKTLLSFIFLTLMEKSGEIALPYFEIKFFKIFGGSSELQNRSHLHLKGLISYLINLISYLKKIRKLYSP